ncbi:M3 family oligoendopeptidase [Devosia sp. 63-57]|uniref:M3 family oligoendopeptidase n=1 Tax=Devosia sp. 63-57 TaxID=1895751 RepID=UPI00086BA074|nr:M3 family oligoendopeptidase [Devosia sp. 63-57]ODT48917.1 MAG: oligoendopeptidase F [Pelagibacterium sp. SCN 63-126]ODU89310.1 MAG: oligoendopeptidase F [Pelagibacterium sp. SCN 63-17]OJX44153.1 MAG: oligoendopeptidase F [Devosia sp. 63-57]
MSAAQKTHNQFGNLPVWDLSDLYPGKDSAEFKAGLEEAKQLAAKFEADYKGKLLDLTRSGGLIKAIKDSETLGDLTGRIGSYAFLQYAQNSTNPDRAKFMGDTNEALTALSTRVLFFELELNRIEDAELDAALERDPELARYRTWFADLRKAKPYQLDDKLEELFHDKSVTAFSAWNRLYDETLATLEFEVEGEKLNLESTLHLLSEKDEKKREAAFHAVAKTLGANGRLFTHITNVLAKDKEISDRWRGYQDIADSRHMANSVEREVVDALQTAVQAAYPRLSHRYYKMKAKWFGKDKLNAWDRNAPLPTSDERVWDWDTAVTTVLDAYGRFSPELAEVAKPFFNSGWIDAPTGNGKLSGAFAHPTVPSAHPYLMLNYLGRTRDIMTLAHELGHGVHQRLAAAQGPIMANTPLTLAETASVFGEMLTFRALLDKTTDPKQRFALLSSKVEDMLNTVVRQIAFYTFERKVHTARRQGELRTEEINAIWMEVQAESLGDGIVANEGYEVFWTYIPHFIHSPFYVYAYAFGDCLVNSLYAQYEKSSEGFAERYFELLKAGGSKHHSELLKPFGLDAKDPQFWSLGLSMIERLIDELEATSP